MENVKIKDEVQEIINNPEKWIELTQLARPIFNQHIEYLCFHLYVCSINDVLYIIDKSNQYKMISLSAFLLKIDFDSDQIGYKEDIGLKYLRKLSILLRSGRIRCEFLKSDRKLYVLMDTNKKNCPNYDYSFDVTNHFVYSIFYGDRLVINSLLFGNVEEIPKSETGDNYLPIIITLLNKF